MEDHSMIDIDELKRKIEESKQRKAQKVVEKAGNSYREKHPDRYRESQKRWRENHKDQIKAYQKAYRERFRAAYLAKISEHKMFSE